MLANIQRYYLPAMTRLCLAVLYALIAASWWPMAVTLGTVASLIAKAFAIAYALAGLTWLCQYRRRRLTQFSAWLAIFSLPFAIGLSLTAGDSQYLLSALLAIAALMLAGLGSYLRMPGIAGIPTSPLSLSLALKIALDEAMLGYFVTASSTPGKTRSIEIADETLEALEIMSRRGWLQNPSSFHSEPQVPTAIELIEKDALGHRYQALRFRSQYQPDAALPGALRWLQYERTHTVRARVFEHAGSPRPWLMCIHGYRMGLPYMDFQLFSPGWLHHKLGFNLIMPLLPLHGHRKEGFRSGDGFFEGDLMNLLHAEAQAQNDLRACIRWLRAHRAVPRLGVYGISLGGLNASLLSCLEPELDSVIAGIPLVDPASVFELNAPRQLIRRFEYHGVNADSVARLLRPISPLAMACQVPHTARAIIAGSHDRILPLAPIQALSAHWDNCRLHWYPGSHLSVRREPLVRSWLCDIWQDCGMLPAQ